MLRKTMLCTAALFLVACGTPDTDTEAETAAEAMQADPDVAPAGEATGLPDGLMVTLDSPDGNAADFRVMAMGGGYHIETGPRGVLYSPTDAVASGDYTVTGVFTEMATPRANHREAYGIVIGGANLEGADQTYAYFIIRGDGSYLVRRRAGAETMNVGGDWAQSDAIVPAPAEGGNSNELTVAVRGDQVHFSVNGTELTVVPAADVGAHGQVGVRVNHNLNVMVSDWSVTPGM